MKIAHAFTKLLLVPVVLSSLALSASVVSQGMPSYKPDPMLQKLETTFNLASSDLKKHPKDAKARDRFVVAGVKYGHESMISPALPPKVKYRQALRIYRQVLKIDPKNPVAKKESDMMISIYKQMGRPVPE